MKKAENEVVNTQAVADSEQQLNALTRDFTPDDVKFLIAPDAASLDKCLEDTAGIIDRLKRFAAHGHSTKELDFDYTEVTFI